MTIIGDATNWTVTYDCRSDNSRGVINDRNILIIQATGAYPSGAPYCAPYYIGRL